MTNKYRYIITFQLLIAFSVVKGFTNDTLDLSTYLDIISRNYPLIQKANLFDDFTEAYTLKGKGVLDPKVTSSYNAKNFGGASYFKTWQSEVKLPTILPIDLSLGFERNNGDFLNAQNSVPQTGLLYGTINLSLVRGLMFDAQRYNVKVAELNGIKGQIEKDLLTRRDIVPSYYNISRLVSCRFEKRNSQ